MENYQYHTPKVKEFQLFARLFSGYQGKVAFQGIGMQYLYLDLYLDSKTSSGHGPAERTTTFCTYLLYSIYCKHLQIHAIPHTPNVLLSVPKLTPL